MEPTKRTGEERFVPAGRYAQLESAIRGMVRGRSVPTLLIYAFDHRTRLGPFLFSDMALIPGAVWSLAAALTCAGIGPVRSVMQMWNPRVLPSQALIDGCRPEMLLVSSMQIHSAAAYHLISDAWKLGQQRPLVLAGGPKAIYEPWDFFGLGADGRQGPDVVVTGEEFVLLELLERILHFRGSRQTMRDAFQRARREGALEDIPGLVYRPDDAPRPPEYLVSTGQQRLVRDLDELPMPLVALETVEPPHRNRSLSAAPLAANQLHRHASIMTVLPTRGCRFRCPFCPIAPYNRFTFRHKSGQRLREEIAAIAERTGITRFFGCDDNFFNRREVAAELLGGMAGGKVRGKPFRQSVAFATEATEADVYNNRDLLPLAREAGLRAIYFGIEDLTAQLVAKGQTPERTEIVFQQLAQHGIAPMPMMIHHDQQPLWSWGGLKGLLNQVRFLRRVGAVSCQITLLTPAVGTKTYQKQFSDGLVIARMGDQPVEDRLYDGNHCVATRFRRPWRRQLNILVGYAAFYNPVNLLRVLLKFDKLWLERVYFQTMGMLGLVKSIWNARGTFWRMFRGPIVRHSQPPEPKYPLRAPQTDPHPQDALAQPGSTAQPKRYTSACC